MAIVGFYVKTVPVTIVHTPAALWRIRQWIGGTWRLRVEVCMSGRMSCRMCHRTPSLRSRSGKGDINHRYLDPIPCLDKYDTL